MIDKEQLSNVFFLLQGENDIKVNNASHNFIPEKNKRIARTAANLSARNLNRVNCRF